MTTRTEERQEFFTKMRDEAPDLDWYEFRDIIKGLQRNARTHHRLAEDLCNLEMTSKQEDARVRREASCERRIIELCKRLGPGFEPIFQGDPRGATVKLKVPSGKTDDWGATGICVPCGN
jgi:hypothetical protein